MERVDRTIPPGACLDTPPHLEELDRSYIRKYSKDVVMRHPIDSHAHPMINYAGKQKMVEEAHDENPFEKPKDLGVDYRF